jgi:hypothetical protein
MRSLQLGDGAVGKAVLVGGTVTVNNPGVSPRSIILLTRQVLGGTAGDLRVSSQSAGQFTITSANGADTSTIFYLVIEP